MRSNRQPFYAFLAIFFLLLSAVLAYFFYFSSKPNLSEFTPPPLVPVSTPIPTLPAVSSPVATATATPSIQTYTASDDNFSLVYSPSRTFYQDKVGATNRYTFYSPQGSFAVHVSLEDWSWSHPDRQFSSDFILAGQNTFVYDINLQTIIDFERDGKKYTIQCVHNASEELKTECEQFLSDFKFL